MENIVPVSEMRYYNQILRDVNQGSQVILTTNGRAKYAVIDVDEWRKTQATIQLLEELQKGYTSLKNEPLVDRDGFRAALGLSK
jgi:prevent-host-death family protein